MSAHLPVVLVALLLFAVALPTLVNAGMSKAADAMCHPVFPEGNTCAGCGMVKTDQGCKKMDPQMNKHLCPTGICFDTPPNGRVDGTCVAPNNCEGQKTEKGGLGDAKGMMDMLKGLMDALKKAGEGGGSPPPPSGSKTGTCPNGQQGKAKDAAGSTGDCGCSSYYQVTVPSSDPCASYVPPTSNSLLDTNTFGTNSASSLLLGALGGTGSTIPDLSTPVNVSDQLQNITSGTVTPQPTQNTSGTLPAAGDKNTLTSGTRGDIVVGPTGATVIGSARDTEANTEIAGFYGGETFTGAPQGIAANLCRNRPWASSIVSFVIPPSFFDGLCAWRGYPVGIEKTTPSPTPAAKTTVTTKIITPATPNPAPVPAPSQATAVPPEVDIWAVPARVPLGARTSVFWNTKGVSSCTVTSPDGSFNETSLSGGASTVPLSGATTFSISCLTPSGTPVTDYFEVKMTI